MHMENNKLSFSSDYMEGAHPQILESLVETNMVQTAGYGLDEFSESAKAKIREACSTPDADIFFLVGGTQTNATMIDAMLRSYQGVIAAETGHISVHEAGAIEFGGHKVLQMPHYDGKLRAADIQSCVECYWQDANHDHMVMPGMVYISQPTEFGTLYSKDELRSISEVCRANNIPLYLDGARMAYALACPENDVTLKDIGALCDAFYIGGTKCGALFGEAVVIPRHNYIPHLFTIIKQHGALLAKGRLCGIQFETLFTDGLYEKLGRRGIKTAEIIRESLANKGYEFAIETPTNQIFIVLDDRKAEELSRFVELGFWERLDEHHVVMRIATSWATQDKDVNKLIELL
ncbi:threonine aldolase family protein [Bifidobacterium tsurumiense]|nr:beta-eliminating lyase-related protein [Bifidobacterium tsurumiense]MSS12775.1 low specificity L-threonine aldolase [Bifidobacterium tsurumiense]